MHAAQIAVLHSLPIYMAGCKRRSTPRLLIKLDTNPRITEYGRSFSVSELNPLLESR